MKLRRVLSETGVVLQVGWLEGLALGVWF